MSLKQDITGIFLLDKKSGLTSNAVLQKVKALWKANKAGHTGSLDPLASGMLPICFGEALKLVRFLLEANKIYEVKIALGQTTDTGDSQGKYLLTRTIPVLSLEEIECILAQFRGSIEQIPPNYSALKQNGQRFYDLARRGRACDIQKKIRIQQIYNLVLNEYEHNTPQSAYLSLTVHCNKGTYIRTLAEDIGEKIGCGAHVVELRRVLVEPFAGYPMYTIDQLNELVEFNDLDKLSQLLLKPELAIPSIPKITVSSQDYQALYHGKTVERPTPESGTGWVQLWTENLGKFFGVGEVLTPGLIVPRRLFKMV